MIAHDGFAETESIATSLEISFWLPRSGHASVFSRLPNDPSISLASHVVGSTPLRQVLQSSLEASRADRGTSLGRWGWPSPGSTPPSSDGDAFDNEDDQHEGYYDGVPFME